jgi:hypothetical protein
MFHHDSGVLGVYVFHGGLVPARWRQGLFCGTGESLGKRRISLRRRAEGGGRWAVGGASALPLTNGRDDPARSSVIFSECGSEEGEEDLASGGRR